MNYDSTKPQLTAADFHGHDAQHMNSLQIAELVQSRHDSVKRTIERLVEQEIIACPPMVDVQENKGNSRNYTTQAYFFSGEQGKLDSITVAAQLCPRFTAAIVKRWQELEQHNGEENTAELAALRAENSRLLWLVDELQDAYTKTHGDALKLLRYRRLGLSSRECAQLLGCSVRSIGRRLARLKQLGFGEQQALPLAAPQGSRLRFADGEV